MDLIQKRLNELDKMEKSTVIYMEYHGSYKRVHGFYEWPLQIPPELFFYPGIRMDRISVDRRFRVIYHLAFCKRKKNFFLKESLTEYPTTRAFPPEFYLSEKQIEVIKDYVISKINRLDMKELSRFLNRIYPSLKFPYYLCIDGDHMTISASIGKKTFFSQKKFNFFLEWEED